MQPAIVLGMGANGLGVSRALGRKGIDVLAGMVVINDDMNLTKEQSYNPDQIEISNIPGMSAVRVRWIVSGNNDYTIIVDSDKGGRVEWTSGT